MPDGGWYECAVGVFVPASPMRSWQSARQLVEVSGYDLTLVLREDRLESAITIAAGTGYIAAIEQQAQAAGLWRLRFDQTAAVLANDVQFDAGTPRLTIINTLLNAINFRPAYADSAGYIICRRYQYPYERTIQHQYLDDDRSVLLSDARITVDQDAFERPNVIVGVVNRTTGAPITSKWTNSDPASKLSTVRRGRKVVRVDTLDDIESQDALDLYVRRAGYATMAGYETVSFDTLLMPTHSVEDMLFLRLSQQGISDRYQERSWSMKLAVNAPMSHTAQRVVLM
jgi:hypothetical protein